MRKTASRIIVAALALGLSACAGLPQSDPLQVAVAGAESMPGEGMELRMLLKLRVQNPNDQQLDYDGVYVKLDVQGRTFATGVSDARGSVPRFGESVIAVPVTVSMLNVVRQVMGAMDPGATPSDKIRFSLEGKLNGPGFRATRFESRGELKLPGAPQPAPDSTSP
jgi:LEA14-like dessication related protein